MMICQKIKEQSRIRGRGLGYAMVGVKIFNGVDRVHIEKLTFQQTYKVSDLEIGTLKERLFLTLANVNILIWVLGQSRAMY